MALSSKVGGLARGIQPAVRWCLAVAEYYGVGVTVTSGKRSSSEQRRLYEQYAKCVREGTFGTPRCPTRWPANPPGTSAHEYGLAWDSVVDARYQDWWNRVREAAGFRVPRNDAIHAEVPNWRQYV